MGYKILGNNIQRNYKDRKLCELNTNSIEISLNGESSVTSLDRNIVNFKKWLYDFRLPGL